jgi:alkylhydroperoxidase family enzyme
MAVEPSGDLNIDKRMEQIVGKPLRVAPLPEEQLPDEARQLAIELRAAFGIPEDGAMPEVVRVMLVHPDLFRAQMDMGVLLAAKGSIPPRERELAVLRNAWLCGAPYEWGEHVDISKRFGVTSEEIERVTKGSKAQGWNDHERAILKGVEELHMDHTLSDETWDVLAKTWNDKQLLEFPVLVGQYISTALQQNTLRVRLGENNPGLAYR